MKFALVLLLFLSLLSGVLSYRPRGHSCTSQIVNLKRNRDRVVKRCSYAIDCGCPPDLPNASVNYTYTKYASTATYSCNEGFSFVGYSRDIECGLFEMWTDILGTCVADCGPPPEVNGTDVCYDGTTVGAVATYTCEDSLGSNEATCDETGMWTPVETPCVSAQFERIPSKGINGSDNAVIPSITEEECLSECLGAEDFLCKSVEYFSLNTQTFCILSEKSRFDDGVQFVDSPNVVFFERIFEK